MKIIVFPKDSQNPYQELLYTPLRSRGIEVEYVAKNTANGRLVLVTFLPRILLSRVRGYTVFHLHWTDAFAFNNKNKTWYAYAFKTLFYWHYAVCLFSIKVLGYKLVWTAHNVLPHEKAFPNDTRACQLLVRLSDLVILHSASALESLKQIEAVPKKSVIIPHGSYIGVYPNLITREQARAQLGIDPEKFVYLYVGQIRSYKGIDVLVDAFSRIKTGDAQLVIAGKGVEPALIKRLHSESSKSRGVLFYEGTVADSDLQIYFAAADIVVLPFKEVTTSGSTLLALSFGKAVVVPSIGDLASLPDSVAYKYFPNTEEALKSKLEEVYVKREEVTHKGREAMLYAQKLAWPAIAEQTYTAIKELF